LLIEMRWVVVAIGPVVLACGRILIPRVLVRCLVQMFDKAFSIEVSTKSWIHISL